MIFHAKFQWTPILRISSLEYVLLYIQHVNITHHESQPSAIDNSTFPRRPQHSQPHTPSQSQQSQSPLYTIIVFGYPPDKYSVTVEYFRSFGGEATDPDPNLEITNCFRIGYRDPGDALRAVRKNGEVLGGSWMIGVKWAVCVFTP